MLQEILSNSLAEPRPYQERIVGQATEHYTNGIKTILVNSPTGSGKTIMGWLTAALLQRTYNIGVGWVAMRRNLLTQAERANVEMQLGCECPAMISMFDRRPPREDALGRPIKLLVVDEAQHDAASSMANLHNKLEPDFVLGLSATPYRTDKVKLCFQKVLRDAGIHQLIQQGYLSPYHHYTIPRWTPKCVSDTYLNERERFGKSVFFWFRQDDARECLAYLLDAGVRAELVIGEDPMSVRDDQLSRFESGELECLVNMMILTEGFDSPSLRTCFVRDSSKGPTIQMSGRVFRKYPDIEFKNVVQSKMTRYPMQKTADPAESFLWNEDFDEWRSVKPSAAVREVHKRTLMALARTQSEMPDFITKRKGLPPRRGGMREPSLDGTGRRDEGPASGAWMH